MVSLSVGVSLGTSLGAQGLARARAHRIVPDIGIAIIINCPCKSLDKLHDREITEINSPDAPAGRPARVQLHVVRRESAEGQEGPAG